MSESPADPIVTPPESARREVALPLALLSATLLVLGFVLVAESMSAGATDALDRALLLAMRNPADPHDMLGPLWVEILARDVTSLGSHAVLTLITLAAAGWLLVTRRRGAALLVVVSVAGGMLLNDVLKVGYGRPRPDLVPHGIDVHTMSFPSGHALLSATVYLTLGALLARVQQRRREKLYVSAVALVLTLAVGASRVYLGVHWPTDVLAGWCIGAAWAIACWAVVRRLQHAGRVRG